MFFSIIGKFSELPIIENIVHNFTNVKLVHEQRRGMKSYLKGHKILIMPLLFSLQNLSNIF